jgi:hypothetical protein
MLSVANKSFMLSTNMLIVIMLSVVMLSVVMLSAVVPRDAFTKSLNRVFTEVHSSLSGESYRQTQRER